MPAPSKLSPSALAEAHRLRSGGASFAAIGAALGVDASTVGRSLRRSQAPGATPADAPVPEGHAELIERLRAQRVAGEPPEPVEPEPDPDSDPAAYLRHRMRAGARLARSAEQAGNLSVAQRASRDVAALASVLARLERDQRDQGDAITITRQEWDAAERMVRDRVDALIARGPIRCSACSRELSIEWGRCRDKIEELDAADEAADERRGKP